MSSNLVWFTKPKGKDLSHEIKRVFQILYGSPVDTILNNSHIAQLKAIAVTYSVENKVLLVGEIHKLINAIEIHTEVHVKEDFG